jgi:hypothetical protein
VVPARERKYVKNLRRFPPLPEAGIQDQVYQFHPVLHPRLAIEIGDVLLHGTDRYAQVISDLFGSVSPDHPVQNLLFPGGEGKPPVDLLPPV